MRWAAVSAVVLVAVAGCSSGAKDGPTTPAGSTTGPGAVSSASVAPSSGSSAASSSAAPSTSAASSASASSSGSSASSRTASSSTAAKVLARMSLRKRVGQLIMIDCPSTGVSAATRAAITRSAVGSVILDGNTTSGVSGVAAVTRKLRGLAPTSVELFIAGDQEGGLVQRLKGSGFSTIPSAVRQGRVAPATLQSRATAWGRQLKRAGLTMNLAPVLDVVPRGGGANPPIGDLDRQYGATPTAVTKHGLAFARGMSAAGIDATVKHFPGLGRVSGNTDTTSGITDRVTTRTDKNLAPFRAAVRKNVPFVMMSTAIYSRIDAGTPAAFSKPIVTGLLRGDLGFKGVVVSDDLGAAKQVSKYSVGKRAVKFVAAGGDLVLSVVASQAPALTSALLKRAKSDPAFRKLVDAAALRVLTAKQARGLL